MRSPYPPVRTVVPAAQPATLAEVKAHRGVTTNDDNDLLTALLAVAVDKLDGWSGLLGRCLVTQTWTVTFDDFLDRMDLPFPASSVTSITYLDEAGDSQTLASTVYALRSDHDTSYVELRADQEWPSVYDDSQSVTITFVAGYGGASAVPTPIKQAIIMMTGQLYDTAKKDQSLTRERIDGIGAWDWDATGAASATMDRTINALIAPYRRVGL